MNLKEATEILDKIVTTQRAAAKNDEEIFWIDWKDVHSRNVLKVGQDILDNDLALTDIKARFEEEILVSLLMHDIGRFYQHIDGKFDCSLKHGALGAEVLEKEYKVDNPYIVLGMKYHDASYVKDGLEADEAYQSLDEDVKRDVFTIARLVQDADKLENYIAYKAKDNPGALFLRMDLEFSPVALEEFFSKKIVTRNADTNPTMFDAILCYLAWQYDLCFDKSKQIAFECGANEYLLGKMREFADTEFKKDNSKIEAYNKMLKTFDEIEEFLKQNKLM